MSLSLIGLIAIEFWLIAVGGFLLLLTGGVLAYRAIHPKMVAKKQKNLCNLAKRRTLACLRERSQMLEITNDKEITDYIPIKQNKANRKLKSSTKQFKKLYEKNIQKFGEQYDPDGAFSKIYKKLMEKDNKKVEVVKEKDSKGVVKTRVRKSSRWWEVHKKETPVKKATPVVEDGEEILP